MLLRMSHMLFKAKLLIFVVCAACGLIAVAIHCMLYRDGVAEVNDWEAAYQLFQRNGMPSLPARKLPRIPSVGPLKCCFRPRVFDSSYEVYGRSARCAPVSRECRFEDSLQAWAEESGLSYTELEVKSAVLFAQGQREEIVVAPAGTQMSALSTHTSKWACHCRFDPSTGMFLMRIHNTF